MAMVRAYRWEDGALWLLDQRRLPHQESWVRCERARDVAAAIREMVVRGAPLIGVAAAYGVVLAVGEAACDGRGAADPGAVEAEAERLKQSRPTAVNLAWAVERVMGRLRREGFRVEVARDEADAIAREDEESCRRIGEAGAPLVPDGARVLTHCNTGSLATAGIGTALGVIRAARAAGRRVKVWATETRPYLQGARLTAWELLQDGFDATLVGDSMAGYLMQRGEVDLVVVGADRIAANGDVANKVGTYALAVLAAFHGIPFYVAAPFSTVDLNRPDGASIPIEERSPDEVTCVGGVRVAPEGVRVWHPAFDVTPARLVTALITDRGVIRPPYEAALRRAEASRQEGARACGLEATGAP